MYGLSFTPSISQKVQDKGAVTIQRDENGNIQYVFNNANGAQVDGVGTVDGTAILTFENTGDTDETQLTYHHEGDSANNLKMANISGNNYNITGENANVTSSGGNAERTIQVDANNSNIDLSNAGGSQFVYMSEESHDNKTTLGYASDSYIDAGKFNYAENLGGADRFETTYDSHGAIIQGSSDNETFYIGGQFGIFDGGAGADTFNALGIYGENEESSYRNVIFGGDGDDTFNDKGGYNIFFGEGGNNTYVSEGTHGIAFLGSESTQDATSQIGSSAIQSYTFVTENFTTNKGVTYNLYEVMNRYKWTLEEFLTIYSQISEENPDAIADHDTILINSDILSKLDYYFRNNQSANK